MRSDSLTLTARYVFPVDGDPILNGWITVIDGQISRVGRSNGVRPDFDLGNVAIVPGFVNAHTHLDLTTIEPVANRPDGSEDEMLWLRRMIAQRRNTMPDESRAAVARNVQSSLALGTTALADITPAGLSWNFLAESPLKGTVFTEILGLKRTRALDMSSAAWTWLESMNFDHPVFQRLRLGISPHAPYSTVSWLYDRATMGSYPLTTHLAEMPEERELLQTREGPLKDFLVEIGAWDPQWEPLGPSPVDYLREKSARSSDWIIAHGTYFRSDELWSLLPAKSELDQRIAVAFCPRTHARFGHTPHPFRTMLSKGVIVCLGTDGLATAPSLSVLDEARFLRQSDLTLGGKLLLTMATLFGAWALRLEDRVGSISPRKRADFAMIALPDSESEDPYSLIFDHSGPVVATMCDGVFVHGPWRHA